jgi:hypothetical protein
MRRIAALALVAACYHAALAPAPSRFADPLALVPPHPDLVIRVDLAVIRQSPLWPKYGPKLVAAMLPGFTGCSYDPISEITTITAGYSQNDNTNGHFVVRGLDRDKTLACLRTSRAQTNTTATFDGDFVTLLNKSGSVNMITFPEPHIMVLEGSKTPTKTTLRRALDMGAPLRKDPTYLELEQRVPPGAAISIVMPLGSKFLGSVSNKLGTNVRTAIVTLHVTNMLSLRFDVAVANANDAQTIAQAVRPQIERMKQLIERWEVRADGDHLAGEIAATEQQLLTIYQLVGPMLDQQDGTRLP